MKRLAELWQQYWFSPRSPTALGACRCIFFAVVLWQFASIKFASRAELDPVFWFPIKLFRFFEISLPSSETLTIVQAVWGISLLLSCLGLMTRISTMLSWIGGAYLLGFINCFGKISHAPQMIVLTLGILALSRCGDSLSIDGLIKHRFTRNRKSLRANNKRSGMYTWPIRLVWLVFVSVFFAAGVAKLRVSGISWVFSDNISNVLIKAHYGTENTWNELGLWVASQQWLCVIVATLSLALELFCPLALFSRRARAIIIPGLFLMQTGIFVLMGTNFVVFLATYVFWVPWNRFRSCDQFRLRSDARQEMDEGRRVDKRLEVARAG